LFSQVAEQERILKTYNDTAQPLPPCGVHQLFEECVRANPKAIALEFSDQAQGMTYEELNTRANRLAKHLLAAGIHKGDLVGVYLERTPNMIVALLAIQKSGAGYVPLDPLYPSERIQWMLEDSKAPVVLTTSDLSEHIGMPASSLPQPKLVCLDTEADFIACYDAKNPDVTFAAADLMYVIFTSGSTGRPKGVQICHQSMVNFLLSFKSTMGVTASDALAAVTTVCFDIAGLELYLPLISGAKV
jgi:non-ribosomal peptide synthetase component F